MAISSTGPVCALSQKVTMYLNKVNEDHSIVPDDDYTYLLIVFSIDKNAAIRTADSESICVPLNDRNPSQRNNRAIERECDLLVKSSSVQIPDGDQPGIICREETNVKNEL
jgi:hypothetical protein